MTLGRKDLAATERLAVAIEGLIASVDALSDVISDRTKQLGEAGRNEMRIIRKVSKLVGQKRPSKTDSQ